MNPVTRRAFENELGNIGEAQFRVLSDPALLAYELRKESSFLSNLGSLFGSLRTFSSRQAQRAKQTAAQQARPFAEGVWSNIKGTAKGFLSPVKGMKAGWKFGEDLPGKGWLGAGAIPDKKTGEISGLERVFSLGGKRRGGGLTRYLPVGPKSLTLAGTAAMLPGSVSKEDPSGQGRSRAERLGGLVGGTAGGLIGAPFGLTGALGGGIAGDVAGSRVGRLIARARKKPKMPDVEESPQAAAAARSAPTEILT